MIRQQPQILAIQACLPCKKQKRKCDKGLPDCALCKRIGRICRYGSALPPDANSDVTALPPTTVSFDIEQYSSSSINHNIKQQILAIIGHESHIREFSTRYFNTIHAWFPIVSRAGYFKKLPHIINHLTPDFGLLSVCMLLIVALPDNSEISSWSQSIYAFIKGTIGLLESTGVSSLELLQCRLLVTLFEVGHRIYPAAYISIGTVARAGVALNIPEDCYRPLDKDFIAREEDSQSRLAWKGTLILDRYISLEHVKGPCVTKGLAVYDGRLETNENGSSDVNLPFATPQEKDFQRLAEVTDLLDKVMLHVHDPTPHQDFNWAEATQLMKTLTSFAVMLKGEGTEGMYMGNSAVAICNSAMMTLYEFGNRSGSGPENDCSYGALVFLESVVEEVVEMTKCFYQAAAADDIDILSPFLAHSIYKAALVLTQNLKDAQGLDRVQALRSLRHALVQMSRRWVAAKRYLDLLKDLPCH